MTLVKSVPLKFVDYFRHEITPNKIDLSYPVLVANSTRTNYAFAIGNRTQELTVNLSNAASQNLEIFQGNINLTCTAGEPTSASTVCLVRLRYTHDTTDMTYLRLRAINSYTLIEKELQDAYGCIHGIDFYTNSVTVNGEAAVGVFNMECNSTVTGTVRGVIVNVYGNGVPSTTSVGLEVRIDGSSAGTLTEGIRIRAVGGNTITTGLRIYGAAASRIVTAINVTSACTTAFNVSVVQSVNTGLNAATVLQHGSYSTALAYGTATSGRLLLRVMNITAAGTAVSVMGDFLKITSSAASTGSLFGHYGYISLGHDTTGAYAMKARLELTASSALGLVSGMLITTGISGTTTLTSGTNAHISGLHIAMSIASAVVDVAQEVMGLYVQTTGIVKDVTGNKIGIKVEHGGSGNYLDYGLQFSNCFDTATAVVHFELTQCTTACAMLIETGDHTTTSAITLSGKVQYCFDFDNADDGYGFEKTTSEKTGSVVGLMIVKDQDGSKAKINVYA